MKTIFLAITVGALSCLISSVSCAQNAPVDLQKLKANKFTKIAPNNPAPSKALEPLAGEYKIKGLQSGLCLGKASKGLTDAITGNLGYGMSLADCSDISATYAIIPRIDGKFTLRLSKTRFIGSVPYTSYSECANVARNVVIGPAAIDISNCAQVLNPVSDLDVGLLDQRFNIVKTTDGYWEIHTQDNECFDARNHGTGVGTEIIKWACSNSSNQKWQLIYEHDLKDNELKEKLIKAGLY